MEKVYYGLTTGIGSLPHREAGRALDLVFKYLPEIPHWPQLPAGSEEEGFVRQYLPPLLERGLVKTVSGRSYFDTAATDWLDRLTRFYEEVLSGDASPAFGFPAGEAVGFYSFLDRLRRFGTGSAVALKGQLSGPVTVGFQLTDDAMQPAFYRDELRDVLVRSLAEQVRWQVGQLGAFGLPVILFIDDPSICCYGQSAFVGLSAEAVRESLLPLIEAAHAAGAYAGVHACAGVDWSLLFNLPFDLVNVDVYHYFISLLPYAAELDRFLARGGALAFGLVPTSAGVEEETAAGLLGRLGEYMAVLTRKGVDGMRLRKQLLLTPSCGTGTLTEAQAVRVYELLREVYERYN
jgi:hypothetical protein